MRYWLTGKLHSSWMIAVVCMAIFIGIVLARYTDEPITSSFGLLIAGLVLAVFSIVGQRRWMVFLAVFAGIIIGLFRGTIIASEIDQYTYLFDNVITISGVVSDDADTDKQGNSVLRLKNIEYDQEQFSGKIWVSLSSRHKDIKRSDRVEVTGKLLDGFGTFSGVMYRAELGSIQRPVPGDIALHVRDWFSDLVRSSIPEPEASLGVGFLVGQRRSLPEDLDTALKIAGLTHIVVASGYNLTILVRIARRLFVKLSKYLTVLISSGLMIGFIGVTGLSPSMSRAGLVTGLSLLAWYFGRKFHPIILLSIAIAATVLVDPTYAWGDVGWQLSFAAFAGVMILAPLLQVYFFGSKKPGLIRQILGETIAATICTLPILMLTFGYISNVAIVANLLIVPLIPLAMLLVFVSGVGALILPALLAAIGVPAYILLSYMTQITNYFANLSWAITEVDVTIWHAAALYVAILMFTFYMWWRTRLDLRQSSIIE